MPVRGIKTNKEELIKLNDLLESAFRNANNDHRFLKLHQQKPIEEDWGRVYEYDPAIDKGLNLKEKKFVAFVGIYPQWLQFGKAKILNGGVRDVGSSPLVRGKGYGTPTMMDALEFMRKKEVDISILFSGANHFYERCGYRGGCSVPSYNMDEKSILQFKKIMGLSKASEKSSPMQINIRNIEDRDLPIINELHQRTSDGLYFSAHRTVDFWKKHFDTNPNLQFTYLVIEMNSEILGYMKYDIQQKLLNKVNLIVKEWRLDFQKMRSVDSITSKKTGKKNGSDIVLKILHGFIDYVSEEAINEKDKIDAINFGLSRSNPIITTLEEAGIKLLESNVYSLSIMFLITNPYSLFTRLKPEIEWRNAQHKLPKGSFYIRFDKSGKFPGGVKIDTNGDKCDVVITNDPKTVEKWEKSIGNSIVCENITALTLFAAGIERVEELDPSDIDSAEMKGNAIDWLKGLFSGVTYDHHELDHY